jgi:tetratricopeptide (TPR) repeat protein
MGVTTTRKTKEPPVTLLRQRMKQHDLTFTAVSNRIQNSTKGRLRPDPSLVWRWAEGITRPSDSYLEALADVLELDIQALREDINKHYARRRRNSSSTTESAGEQASTSNDLRRDSLQGVRELVRRRSMLKTGAVLLIGGTAEALMQPLNAESLRLAAVAGKSTISQGTLEAFGILVDHLAGNLWRYEFQALEEQLLPHVEAITELLEGSLNYKERGELCLRGAQLCGILGLMASERGMADAARLHLNNAFNLAEEIDHHNLMAWVIAQESNLALYAGRADVALALAQGARRFATGAMVVDLASNEARAHAFMGNRRDAAKAIKDAERAFGGIPPHEDSDLAYSLFGFPRSMALVRFGRSWIWLKESTRAQAAAQAGIELIRWNKVSQQGQAQLVIAAAHAQMKEPEQACKIAAEALQGRPQNVYFFTSLSSQLMQYLEPYKNEPFVHSFKELLSQYEEDRGLGRGIGSGLEGGQKPM